MLWQRVDGVVTVCDTRSGELYDLNPIAGSLWSVINGTTRDELVELMAAQHSGEARETLRAYVDSLLVLLQGSGLITVVDKYEAAAAAPR